MYVFLISLVIGLFVALLFVNIYFRVKVFKSYSRLRKNDVDMNAEHILNKDKLKNEILPKYPEYRDEILQFSSHLRYSIRIAVLLIALITIFGGILHSPPAEALGEGLRNCHKRFISE